jgi:hypothetical protein
MRRHAIALVFPCILLSILVFSQVQFAHATSWLPVGEGEIRLTANSSFDMASSVIQTNDRRIWVVWEQSVLDGRAIFYKTSSNYGISWSSEKNLTTVPNLDMNQDPSVVQLSNGTIMVVWSALKVPPPEPDFTMNADPLHISIPQGSSDASTIIVTSIGGFSGPVDLKRKLIDPGPITTNLVPAQVTPPPNGNANSTLTISVGALAQTKDYHILVTGNSTSLNQTKSVTITLTVTAMSGSSADSYSLASDPIGATQTEGSYDIYYKTSNDNGATWSNDTRLVDDPGADLGPCVVQASNGTVWVFWSSNRMGNNDVYYKVCNNGVSWSSDIRLTSDSTGDERPAATQTQDGRIWAVWHSNRSGNNEIYYNYYNMSTFSWKTSDFRLTTTAADINDITPSILQTSDGVIWIFWKSMGNAQPPYIYYRQSLDNGATWSGNLEFTDGTYDEAWPMTTQSCDAKIWVTWSSFRDGNWEIYYKTSLVHNIAVTDVAPSPLQVYQMENVSVSATVHNFGDFGESVTVNCYANTTLVDSRITTLAGGSWVNLVLNWNTSFSRGDYYVKVEAVPVPGEVYTEDNTMIHGTVRVKFLGDVNDNGFVNVLDVFSLGKAFGSSPGSPNWNEEADMNGDEAVNSADLSRLVGNFGNAG